jgi:Putative Actinobacterial Holin-X, holin superfamily III
MPETHEEKLGVIQLLKQLFGDGVRIVEVELALARSEAASTMRGYLIGLLVGMLAIATTIVALFILAQSAAMALTGVFTSPATAYLVVGLLLVLVTAGLALVSRQLFSYRRRPVGMVFKQLFGDRVSK